MKEIFSSASKIVLLLMVLALIMLTFVGKVDPKDFINAMFMVLSFYFTKSTPSSK